MSILEDNNNQQYKLASVNNLQGLIVTINYPQENGLDKEFSSKKIEEDEILFGNGERIVEDSFSYGVGFDVKGMGVLFGQYRSDVRGVYSDRYVHGVIHKLNTYHTSGAYFPVRDYTTGDAHAYNIFSQPYDIGSIALGRGDFIIENGGRVVFLGVR